MSKPIVFFDLETTGKSNNPDDVRIIEISAVKVDPETLDVIGKLYHKCNNDGVPIQPDATERHGMVEEDLKDCLPFTVYAKETFDFFDGCDVGGYYCTVFDIPILYYSFIRAGLTWKYKDVKNFDIYTLYSKYNSGKLADVYKKYTGKDLNEAHHASADIDATLEVYKTMRARNEEFEDADLDTFSSNLDMPGNFKVRLLEDGVKEIYLDFGKWKGVGIDKVDKSYFKWMMDNESFPVDTRHYAKVIYEKK
jgi:DNA polymerase-3 subunit epsilon